MASPNVLGNVAPTLLPPTITTAIFDQAVESSSVMQLARRVPLSVTAQTEIPVPMDVPAAGWVVEGGAKPVATNAVGTKTMRGKKVALLVPVSEEVARSNPAGLYSQLQQDLPTAIGRAFDHAAIHGKDLRTGGAGPFADYLLQTSTSVALDTSAASAGGIYKDLVTGEQAVVDANYDFNGYVADPRLRPLLKLSVDADGRPLWVDDPTVGTNGGSLAGHPAFYNRGVSGKYRRAGNKVQVITQTGGAEGGNFTIGAPSFGVTHTVAFNATAASVQTAIRAWGTPFEDVTVTGSNGGPFTVTFPTNGVPLAVTAVALTGGTTPTAVVAQSPDQDTGLRAVGGDWSQCAYGVGMDMTIRVSTEASYVDEAGTTHSAFQDNLVLLLVEAYYGFVVGNPDAFVAYTAS